MLAAHCDVRVRDLGAWWADMEAQRSPAGARPSIARTLQGAPPAGQNLFDQSLCKRLVPHSQVFLTSRGSRHRSMRTPGARAGRRGHAFPRPALRRRTAHAAGAGRARAQPSSTQGRSGWCFWGETTGCPGGRPQGRLQPTRLAKRTLRSCARKRRSWRCSRCTRRRTPSSRTAPSERGCRCAPPAALHHSLRARTRDFCARTRARLTRRAPAAPAHARGFVRGPRRCAARPRHGGRRRVPRLPRAHGRAGQLSGAGAARAAVPRSGGDAAQRAQPRGGVA